MVAEPSGAESIRARRVAPRRGRLPDSARAWRQRSRTRHATRLCSTRSPTRRVASRCWPTRASCRPVRPDKLVGVVKTLKRWGRGPASGYITSGLLCPDSTALVDDLGSLSFGELDRRTNALANSLADGRHRRGRRRRDHVPQPPRLRRGDGRRREARRGRPLPQHGLRRTAAHRGRQAREPEGADLRRGVRAACSRRPASGASASSPGTTATGLATRRSTS